MIAFDSASRIPPAMPIVQSITGVGYDTRIADVTIQFLITQPEFVEICVSRKPARAVRRLISFGEEDVD